VPETLRFLGKSSLIIEEADFGKFNFSDYDLFIAVDSATPSMVTGDKNIPLPKMPVVVIDHHPTNEFYGDINLIDASQGSCAELVYRIFEDWEFEVDSETATYLMTGIIGDTGAFRYSNTTSETLRLAARLLERGASKEEIILNLFNKMSFELVKLLGVFIENLKLEEEYKFAWSAIDFQSYAKFGLPDGTEAANSFIKNIDGLNFGIKMYEEEEGKLRVSFRSRTDFDVSKIAQVLGGGGHRKAAGVSVNGLDFDKAVAKVVETAKRFSAIQ